MENIEKLKGLYLFKFEELDKNDLEHWVTPEFLSESTRTSIYDIEQTIKHTNDFVKNSKGKITRKKDYIKKESLLKRINDMLNGTIS